MSSHGMNVPQFYPTRAHWSVTNTLGRDTAFRNMDRLAELEEEGLCELSEAQRAERLYRVAKKDGWTMYLCWIWHQPEDIALEWDRADVMPVKDSDDRQAANAEASEAWTEGRMNATFGMWDWKKGVRGAEEKKRNGVADDVYVGPRNERDACWELLAEEEWWEWWERWRGQAQEAEFVRVAVVVIRGTLSEEEQGGDERGCSDAGTLHVGGTVERSLCDWLPVR
ncbi:hypothetical protein BAUCODRAFT_23714 [Baudoinia panamericana UAMH 10762]|uniref:Uncharacterized protein n=1 Tax=Baudoinia panamericana (strain UAMH 10762) TaxID=717646 RepID=M2NDX7_BAUPA|nr:uncharacterized protein BAUCODRAFT_23714 [Baudoinia panamericana UAMH 10762]EMC97419.1 hypothetical protein BAUCODRAFT_23714 [Baudoinia panamericana UAMH 10762]